MTRLIIAALLVCACGCAKDDGVTEITLRIHRGENANERLRDTMMAVHGPVRVRVVYDKDWESPRWTKEDTLRIERTTRLRAASKRSAAFADSVTGITNDKENGK